MAAGRGEVAVLAVDSKRYVGAQVGAANLADGRPMSEEAGQRPLLGSVAQLHESGTVPKGVTPGRHLTACVRRINAGRFCAERGSRQPTACT